MPVNESNPTKISTARRMGDAYELLLFAKICLRMIVENKFISVFHEYKPALPVDDVVVHSENKIDCYQVKHAMNPHAFLEFDDLVGVTDLNLNIKRLRSSWENLKPQGNEIRLHIYIQTVLQDQN